MMDNLEKIYLSTYFLCAFKKLRDDIIFKSFVELLKNSLAKNNLEENIKSYCDFVFALKNQGYNDFSKYLTDNILNCENIFDEIQIEKELKILTSISKIKSEDIKNFLSQKFPNYKDMFENLPHFSNNGIEIYYEEMKSKVQKDGDIYKNNHAFIFDNDFELKPVDIKENISFRALKGYVEQKKVLYDNTKALLKGSKVNNILLYGDAGCGKSSSVRALLNEFEEIKMVQIFKNNLMNLDKLFLKLKSLPHKFIIFIDDVTFDEGDDSLSCLKAILEGSLIQCPQNAVIYATSNRRHLVKQTFSTRLGDEIHLKDTINEITSLSERFGINLFFSKPSNDEFNQIVIELARDNNLQIDDKTLIEKAQRLALIKGTRSPRIAKQLIDNLVAHIEI